ncbi:MAG: VOC family protein [Prevotellaceae bacterium]|jgi:uncharacterized glyoxalase superfamily protein PhnB|nr:VOC family protein [Prevotellaceae bacterium]
MKITKITPNFAVADVKQTVSFYQDILGFNLIMAVPETQDGVDQQLADNKEYVSAMVVKDNVEFFFQRIDSFKNDTAFENLFQSVFAQQQPVGASVSFYMYVEDIESLYNYVKSKNAETTEIHTTWYGMREFYMKDNNGYVLGFAEKQA